MTEESNAVELTEPNDAGEATDVSAENDKDISVAPAVESKRRNGLGRRVAAGARRNIAVIVIAAALVISAAVTGWLYFAEYRPDQQTNAAASDRVLQAAKDGTVALLSYSPDTLDKDFANAKAKLTGDFLSYYTQFTTEIVTPAAKDKQVKTAASVVRAAVSEIHPDSAVVLVFINQVTTSKENPDGAFAASAVKVSMTKDGDRWLINAFDPV